MFLVDDNERLPYEVRGGVDAGGALFHYKRLVQEDLRKLRYLVQLRGTFDDLLYDKACAAISMRHWDGLKGVDREIPWPLRMPASAITEADQTMVAGLRQLVPTMTDEELAELHGAFFVLERIPDTDIVTEFARLTRELEPDLLKKRYSEICNGASRLPTKAPNGLSPVLTAGETKEVASHAIAAG